MLSDQSANREVRADPHDQPSFVTTTALLNGLADPSNTGAWEAFVGRYRPVVEGYSRKLGISAADSEDLAQQVFAEFARGYASGAYQREKGRLRAWLFGIARNQVLAFRRRSAAAVALDCGLPEQGKDDHQLQQLWEREWQDQILRRSMEALRGMVHPRTLEAFVLFALEGRAAEAVAEQLGMTLNGVYGSKRRVLEQLAELQSRFEDEA